MILVSYLLVSINLRLRREVRAYKARQAAFPILTSMLPSWL